MSFTSVLFALLLEQLKPLSPHNLVYRSALAWVRWCSANLYTEGQSRGGLAWGVALSVPVLKSFAVFLLIEDMLGWPAAMVWNTVVLYLCMGFRQFSFHFTDIREALMQADWPRARQLLARWRGVEESALPESELVGRLVESSVLAAHRHVFGVLAGFSLAAALGLGPAGAVAYRMAELLGRKGIGPDQGGEPQPATDSPAFAQAMWQRADWLPARVTAISFAVVGNFEDALDGWRRQAQGNTMDADQVVLAASSGALGLQLPGVEADPHGTEVTMRPMPQPDHLAAVVGLMWRTVVMWMVLLALLTLARLLG